MDQIIYMNEFLKKNKPIIPFRYELKEEGRYLSEIDRAEKLKLKANERKLEEKETKKIVAVLEKQSRDEKVAEARCKQLTQMTDELRDLHHYLELAKNTKELVAQLKLEDAEIDRRVEVAKEEAQKIRAAFRAYEERKTQEELTLKRKARELLFDLKDQIEENDARRLQRKRENLEEGIQLRKYMDKLNEKYRQELQAAIIAKEKFRKDTIEFLREKIELKKQQKIDDTNLKLVHFEMERKRDAMQQAIVDARNQRIQRQMEISAKLGEKVWAINNAKEQNISNLIDLFVHEKQHLTEVLEEKEQEKAIENHRIMQCSMEIQMEERQKRKERLIMRTMDLANKRLTQSHSDSEMNLLRKRMEREHLENERYLKSRELEKKEKEAEEKGPNVVAIKELKEKQEIEAVRIKTLQEQPVSVLRYLPDVLLRSNYLPQPLADHVKEQVLRDPIPVFNVKRHQRHIKRIKSEGGNPVVCCESCPTRKPISHIF